MKKQFVSVIMPVYNGEKFISSAIESILLQTYQHFELFIVNDNSSDRTKEIIELYKAKFPQQIRLIHLKKRRGAYGAMNSAFKYARGEFIAPMDSDDVSHPERLMQEVRFLLKHPNTVVVGSWARIIDQEGNVIGKKVFGLNHKEIYRAFFTVHPLVHPSCMLRRSLLPKRDKLYKNMFGVNDDYYTFFTLLNQGKFSNIPQYLLDYRIHSGNASLQHLKSKFFDTVKIRVEAVRHLGYKPDLFALLRFFMQIFLVSIIPENMLLKVYLYIKGIYRFQFKFVFGSHAAAGRFAAKFVEITPVMSVIAHVFRNIG